MAFDRVVLAAAVRGAPGFCVLVVGRLPQRRTGGELHHLLVIGIGDVQDAEWIFHWVAPPATARPCAGRRRFAVPEASWQEWKLVRHPIPDRHLQAATDDQRVGGCSSSPSLRASHLVVGAWIRIVIKMATKVTEAIICAPGALMPSKRPARPAAITRAARVHHINRNSANH